jgi:hypothetical protein
VFHSQHQRLCVVQRAESVGGDSEPSVRSYLRKQIGIRLKVVQWGQQASGELNYRNVGALCLPFQPRKTSLGVDPYAAPSGGEVRTNFLLEAVRAWGRAAAGRSFKRTTVCVPAALDRF